MKSRPGSQSPDHSLRRLHPIIRDALGRLPEVVKVDGKPKEKHLSISVKKGSLSREDLVDEITRLGDVVGP